MTQEQYEKLKAYENHLYTAKNCDYVRGLTPQTVKELADLYEEIISKNNNGLKSGCSRCRLRSLKDLARVFYQYKEAQEKEKEEAQEPEPETKVEETEAKEIAEAPAPEPKPKKTTKKSDGKASPKKSKKG